MGTLARVASYKFISPSFWFDYRPSSASSSFIFSVSRSNMALFKALVIASLLLFLLLVDAGDHTAGLEEEQHTLTRNDAGGYPPQKIEYCRGACAGRCRLSSRPNLCKRACGTCCARCNCVPPGTYGNKEQCPCYAKMTTRGNKPKCP
ncbi:hypothetical protein H6P81_018882 [Aristolochia fimbriata]|uniref:Uncharacterized protein n=1 Tax=Aristolochia fimbriata TaxID=158543 RepID=A0AAV7E6N0_ARIFI|nr:hypothetical protein H6P81_018882 [Aristolochia fimbriata]